MAKKLPPFLIRLSEHLTRLGEALASQLEESAAPIITNYKLFLEVRRLYRNGRKLYLRKQTPNIDDFERARRNLIQANVLTHDQNYRQAYRIISNSDLPAEGICCIVDPFCYVSHLSAMQRYGLTDRRPKSLHLTVPGQAMLKELREKVMREDYDDDWGEPDELLLFKYPSHPPRVRRRPVHLFHTVHLGEQIPIRGGSFARIATIGQTFLDMVTEPALSGGMAHVLDVWRKHARIYLDDIFDAVNKAPTTIAKIRAGYILEEDLGFKDNRIKTWAQCAQRGGSRVLDPTKPYAPTYSEKWMISINV